MKNIIPLVIAVILGLAAVFAVSRTVSKNKENTEEMVEIVAASRMLGSGEAVAEAFIVPREVPLSALPKSETVKQGKNLDAKEETFTRTVTSVIFPRVRILEITPSGGVFLSLPPQQALALTAISREAELYPLLRKTNDTKALNRKDGGIFENSALTRMIEGLTPIDIPAVPAEIKE